MVFIPVANALKDHHLIYIDTDTKFHRQINSEYRHKQHILNELFDQVIYLDKVNKPEEFSGSSVIIKMIYLRRLNIFYRYIRNSIEQLRPDVIILSADYTDIHALCNMFFHKTIKLFIVQQGSLTRVSRRCIPFRLKSKYLLYRYIGKIPYVHSNPEFAPKDHFIHLLWSDFFKLNPHVKTISTGNPAWDVLLQGFNEQIAKTGDLYQYYRELQNTKTICYTTQPLDGLLDEKTKEFYYQTLQKTFSRLEDLNIIIKVHPRETTEKYEKLFPHSSYPHIRFIHTEKTMDEVLSGCFVMITAWSITSYQAMAKGVHVIIINPQNQLDYSYRFPAHTIPIASNAEELISRIKEASSGAYLNEFLEMRERFLTLINTNTQPISARKVADAILDAS